MDTTFVYGIVKVVSEGDKISIYNVPLAISGSAPSLKQFSEAEYKAKCAAIDMARQDGLEIETVDCLTLADRWSAMGGSSIRIR